MQEGAQDSVFALRDKVYDSSLLGDVWKGVGDSMRDERWGTAATWEDDVGGAWEGDAALARAAGDQDFGGWGDTERGSWGSVGGRGSPLGGGVNKEDLEGDAFEDLGSTFGGADKGQEKEWSRSGGGVETKPDLLDKHELLESSEIEFA
jgi:hypothetical protein